MGSRLPGEWRPLASVEAYVTGPPLALPPAVGHRGEVRAACVCAHTPRPSVALPVSGDATAPAANADDALSAAEAGDLANLVWLLHRRDGGRTELLVRVVPLAADGAASRRNDAAASGAHAVERLGKYADATALLCAGGSDLWVWTSRGVAYRWCLHTRRCLTRVDVAAAGGRTLRGMSGMRPPVPTLHHPTRELLAVCPDGTVLAVSPGLRPASRRDDGFADGRLQLAVRRVSSLRQLGDDDRALDAVAQGPLLFVLQGNSLAQVVGVARSPFMLAVYHLPTGRRLGLTELPALDPAPASAAAAASAAAPASAHVSAALLNARAGGTFAVLSGATTSHVALLAPDVCAATAAAVVSPVAHSAVTRHLAAAPPDAGGSSSRVSAGRLREIAALLGEASAWGGSLERCEAALAVVLTQASLRASCAPGTDDFVRVLAAAAERSRTCVWRDGADADNLPAALHPALRSLVTLQALLYAGAPDSPIIALAAAQAADAARDVYCAGAGARNATAAAASFQVYTPLAASIAPLAVAALQSPGAAAEPVGRTPPVWAWAALHHCRSVDSKLLADGDGRAWAATGLEVRAARWWLAWRCHDPCFSTASSVSHCEVHRLAQVVALARQECEQRREHAAAACLALFASMLTAEASCECAALGCMQRCRPSSNAARLETSPAARAALLANALARVVDTHAATDAAHSEQVGGSAATHRSRRAEARVSRASRAALTPRAFLCPWLPTQPNGVQGATRLAAPLAVSCYEGVCMCLATTAPSALPLFVRALCAEPAGAPRVKLFEQMQLAQRALQVLPPVLGQQPPRHSCAAAQQAALCCHAELLCLAGKQALGMWLALQPSTPGAPTEWASAVRLLEKECSGGGGSTRDTLPLTAPLMFEVLALKVCDTLAPDETAAESAVSLMGVNAEDESETLAACVTHLFIAAKTVATAIRRDAGAASASVCAMRAHDGMHSRLNADGVTLFAPLLATAAQARQQGMSPSVLDAIHDLLEQAVQGWRCTTRLKA
jgi:hypothetical protein